MKNSNKNVYFIEEINPVGMKLIEPHANIYVAEDKNNFIKDPNLQKAQILVTRLFPIDKKIIESCPKLKYIGRHGVGLDNIDLETAKKNNIKVINTPNANLSSVVEYAIMGFLVLFKDLFKLNHELKNGNYNIRTQVKGQDLFKKKLGIVGLGNIGQNVAKVSKQAFNMEVLAYDPFVDKNQAEDLGVILYENLQDMLREIDVLSLHLSLNDNTRGIIGVEELNCMSEDSYIINSSRGGIIDEKALYEALKNKQIGGAVLDVFEKEPPSSNNPLFKLDNVVVTPHVAGATNDAIIRMSTTLAKDVIRAIKNQKPENLVDFKKN